MIKFVFIEGNIGSGKTTLLNRIRKLGTVRVLDEPLAAWLNAGGGNMLKWFYDNADTVAFQFETYVAATRLNSMVTAMDDPGIAANGVTYIVAERSLWSQLHCFVPTHTDTMAPALLATLTEILYTVIGGIPGEVDVEFVYMHTPAAVCLERIAKRGRDGEQGISLEYLTKLEEHHDAFFVGRTDTTCVPDQETALETVLALIKK